MKQHRSAVRDAIDRAHDRLSPSRLLLGAISIAFLFSTLQSTAAFAGACEVQDRTYCVTGLSTGSDWDWEVDTFSGSVDASAAGLSPGDPASDIVAVMLSDMASAGATAAISGSSAACFVVTSCFRLVIDGTIVTTTAVSFNPDIFQIIPEPSSTAMIASGVLALEALRRRRLRTEGRAAKKRSGESC